MMFFQIYKNKSFYILLLFSLIQQSIVASSNYWLVDLTEALSVNSPITILLLLYLSSLIFPYIPGCLALITLNQWIVTSQERDQGRLTKIFDSAVKYWPSDKNKNSSQALLLKQGPEFVQDRNVWVYNLWDSFLNFSFNIFMIAALIDYTILGIFMIGFVASVVIIKIQKHSFMSRSQELEVSKHQLTQLNQRFWDNVVLANHYSKNHFLSGIEKGFESYRKGQLRLDSFSQVISLSLNYASSLPVLGFMAYCLLFQPLTAAESFAIVFLIPRVFQVLNNSHFFL